MRFVLYAPLASAQATDPTLTFGSECSRWEALDIRFRPQVGVRKARSRGARHRTGWGRSPGRRGGAEGANGKPA